MSRISSVAAPVAIGVRAARPKRLRRGENITILSRTDLKIVPSRRSAMMDAPPDRQLQRNRLGQRLLVIWDGSPIHRRVEALPGYAPDLNPWDEGGWHHLKNVEMRNLVCRDLEELHEEFHLAVGRLRQKPHLVQSFFAQAGLKI